MDKDGPETMREAVARAIAKASCGNGDCWRLYTDEADAAIRTVLERLREPSATMIEAGMKCAHIDLASEYRAMLDAAAREVG